MTNDTNLTLSYTVQETPQQVFQAIRNARGWWSEGIEGPTADLGDEFDYRHVASRAGGNADRADPMAPHRSAHRAAPEVLHRSRQRVVESVPGRTIVWQVLDANLSFAEKPGEWKGTSIRFELSEVPEGTTIHFTHEGLGPSCDCYDACSKGWGLYVGQSLRALITTGRGLPDTQTNTRPE